MTSPTESPTGRQGRSPSSSGVLPTRISWAWATLFVGVALGIALVDFLAQNTRSVRIEFFSASGHVPVAVALLVAALAGAALVLIVGGARMGQLRRGLRSRNGTRGEVRAPAAEPNAAFPGDRDSWGSSRVRPNGYLTIHAGPGSGIRLSARLGPLEPLAIRTGVVQTRATISWIELALLLFASLRDK